MAISIPLTMTYATTEESRQKYREWGGVNGNLFRLKTLRKEGPFQWQHPCGFHCQSFLFQRDHVINHTCMLHPSPLRLSSKESVLPSWRCLQAPSSSFSYKCLLGSSRFGCRVTVEKLMWDIKNAIRNIFKCFNHIYHTSENVKSHVPIMSVVSDHTPGESGVWGTLWLSNTNYILF